MLSELSRVHDVLDKAGVQDESNHGELASEELFKAKRVLARLESTPARTAEHVVDVGQFDLRSSLMVKLPTFDGDIMKWMEFWELVEVSVHCNPKYAAVQKFVILKSHLGVNVKQAMEGIPVSAEGYNTAVDVLKRRFARDDIRREM